MSHPGEDPGPTTDLDEDLVKCRQFPQWFQEVHPQERVICVRHLKEARSSRVPLPIFWAVPQSDDFDVVKDMSWHYSAKVLDGCDGNFEDILREWEELDLGIQLAASLGQGEVSGELLGHGAPVVTVTSLENHGVVVWQDKVTVVDLASVLGSILNGLDVVDTESVFADHVADLGRESEKRGLIWLSARKEEGRFVGRHSVLRWISCRWLYVLVGIAKVIGGCAGYSENNLTMRWSVV
jgi:hypothetical protein